MIRSHERYFKLLLVAHMAKDLYWHSSYWRTNDIRCFNKEKSLSRVQLFVTLWTVAYQASPSMVFSRQEYWSRLPFPSPVDLPDPGIEPRSPALQADTLTSELPGKPILPPRKVHVQSSRTGYSKNTFTNSLKG